MAEHEKLKATIQISANTDKAEKQVKQMSEKIGKETSKTFGGAFKLPKVRGATSPKHITKKLTQRPGMLSTTDPFTGGRSFSYAPPSRSATPTNLLDLGLGSRRQTPMARQLPTVAKPISRTRPTSRPALPPGATPRAGLAARAGAGAAAVGARLAAAAGPIGIAIGAVAIGGFAVKKFADGVISATGRVLGLARSFSEISGPLLSTFAKFDVQMLLLKKRIGDGISPAIERLTEKITGLLSNNIDNIVAILETFAGALSRIIEFVDVGIQVGETARDYSTFTPFGASVHILENAVDWLRKNNDELKKGNEKNNIGTAGQALSPFISGALANIAVANANSGRGI